jgi:RsiW-degrading membrane proteinase PrsW (M82 family)
MLLAIIFINVWGVLQLVALGSFARTVRIRTALAGIAVGLFFCAPFAALLEYTWVAAAAALTGHPATTIIAVGGYTVDPPVEEVIRILPLALAVMIPAVRRQLSVTDCVLIGAAAGAGFGLAEDLYRFGALPQRATAIPGGWTVPFEAPIAGRASQAVFIPSVITAMGGWLPDLGVARWFGLETVMFSNRLLIWSAIAGLGVGLWLRLEGVRRWYVAAALLAYASGAHAANNADITAGRELLLTVPFRLIAHLEPLTPIAALAVAFWIDRRRQQDHLPEHLLASEQAATQPAFGSLQAAVARLPESLFWVERFVRLRRVYNSERSAGGSEAENLRLALTAVRTQLDDQLQRPGSWSAAAGAWSAGVRRALREPGTMLFIALTLPSTLWFVLGGWPATAGVQRVLSGGLGWGLVVGLTIAAQAWLAWQILLRLRLWRRLERIPIGEAGVALVLGGVGAAGALGWGAFGLWYASASPTTGTGHAIDALTSLTPAQLFPMINLGPAMWNALFTPSPTDLRIPVPGSGGGYFTPTGVRRTALNNLIERAVGISQQVGDAMDPFRSRRYNELLQRYGAASGSPPIPRLQVGDGDPNDMSEKVGDYFFWAAEVIFHSPFGLGVAESPGGRGPVTPAPRGPSPTRSGVDPLAATVPAQRSPAASTLPPQRSPLASTARGDPDP